VIGRQIAKNYAAGNDLDDKLRMVSDVYGKKYTIFVGRRAIFLSLGVAHRDLCGTNIIKLVLRKD